MITLKSFAFSPYQVNTYVLNDETKECIIIDPACYYSNEIELLNNYIEGNNLKPLRILNTHSHFDHTLGNRIVSEKYNINICLSKDDMEMYNRAIESASVYGMSVEQPPAPHEFIKEGDNIEFGDSLVKVIAAPGHSPGSLLYYSEEQKFIIVGDVLFNGGVGRTDLPGGNMITLISSIKEKILTLEDDIIVHCGHGPDTSVGMERKMNPFLNSAFI